MNILNLLGVTELEQDRYVVNILITELELDRYVANILNLLGLTDLE